MSLMPSTPPRLAGILMRVVVCVSVGLSGAGCGKWSDDRVEVEVAFGATGPAQVLTDVSVIVGSDKFYWTRLAPGQVEAVTLRPDPRDEKQLTLLYSLNGQQQSWDGPRFAPATSYRIKIRVNADGTVTHRSCILPCKLD